MAPKNQKRPLLCFPAQPVPNIGEVDNTMKVETIPILADAIKEYYDNYELEELCKQFEIEIEYEGMYLDHLKLARKVIDQIEHDKNKRFLETILPTLLSRCNHRIANTTWENTVYHEQLLPQLELLQILIGHKEPPAEVTLSENHILSSPSEAIDFLGKAQTQITLVDPFISAGALDCLQHLKCSIRLLTRQGENSIDKDLVQALKEFLTAGHTIEVRQHAALHDRYILFNDCCWIASSGLQDIGKKPFCIIECIDSKLAIVEEIERKWGGAEIFRV
jgi:hypothetical protein